MNDINLIKLSIRKIYLRLKSFEAVLNYIKNIKKLVAAGNKKSLKDYLLAYDLQSAFVFDNLYHNIKPIIKKKRTILTLSNSQTVFQVLRLHYEKNKHIRIIVAESQPAIEGRLLAKKLLKLGIKVTVIPDCSLAVYVEKSDMVLIGVDKILKNFDVINKTGSKNAALIAKYYKVPFVVAAAEEKFSTQTKFKVTYKNPSEIWNFKHSNLTIENVYFEIVPKNLITQIVTEKNQYLL